MMSEPAPDLTTVHLIDHLSPCPEGVEIQLAEAAAAEKKS